MISLARSLWRGEMPLIVTYWLYGVLGSVLLNVPLIVAEEYSVDSPAGTLAVFGYSLIVLAYSVFVAVAIWRAATRHEGSRLWAGLAKVVVILGLARFVVEIAKALR